MYRVSPANQFVVDTVHVAWCAHNGGHVPMAIFYTFLDLKNKEIVVSPFIKSQKILIV